MTKIDDNDRSDDESNDDESDRVDELIPHKKQHNYNAWDEDDLQFNKELESYIIEKDDTNGLNG
jgi:hypothetical protein